MSAKVHMHMHVSDLAKSREFYEKFLGEGPVKVKTGYAKFLPAWAPVNLALSHGGAAAPRTADHLGNPRDPLAPPPPRHHCPHAPHHHTTPHTAPTPTHRLSIVVVAPAPH